jgi:hypothetical protein
MLDTNGHAFGVDHYDVRVVASGDRMAGGTPVAGVSHSVLACQGFGKLHGGEFFPNPARTIEEIGMPKASTDQGFLQ